jgi:polygalacturonase
MKMALAPIKTVLAVIAMVVVAGQVLASMVPSREFNVSDFGGMGDGTALDTLAIQKAVDACDKAGGGTVHFPPGIYLTQPFQLCSKTTLQIDAGATIKATDDPKDFLPASVSWNDVLNGNKRGPFVSLISGNDLNDVTICGSGTIDGSGARWWVPAEAARQRQPGYTLPRPNLIGLSRVQHLVVKGITLRNSPKFHLVPDECEDVLISGVTIRAPEHAANTDAIDPSDCRNVLITNCTLDVGDDDVAIKAGRKLPGREFASENITVTGCTFLHGHGMSIGSETAGGVRNVTVENCTFDDTENGLRIKSDSRRGGLVQDILYRNIKMTDVTPAITFTCYYMNNSAMDANRSQPTIGTVAGGDHVPKYRDIRVVNLIAICPRSAGLIEGLPENCISNVDFENVQIASETGLKIENARGIVFKNSAITTLKGPACIPENAGVEGLSDAR